MKIFKNNLNLFYLIALFLTLSPFQNVFGAACNNHSGSCFLPGTLIQMQDGTQKKIEEVQVGDKVKGYDLKNGLFTANTVEELESPMRTEWFEVKLDSGKIIKTTSEHPIYVKEYDGWASIDPEATRQDTNGEMITKPLEIGQHVLSYDETFPMIISIIGFSEEVQTYNLKKVTNNNTFFAEGALVHNKTSTSCSAWSPCVGPCGSIGSQSRTCYVSDEWGIFNTYVETQACTTAACTCIPSCTDSYNACSAVLCGTTGIQTGTRTCINADCSITQTPISRSCSAPPCPVCVPSCACAANTCTGLSCSDGCGGTCDGTKDCCTPSCACAANTCTGLSCPNGCGGNCAGTKDCCTPSCACAANTCVGSTCPNGCGGTCAGTLTDTVWTPDPSTVCAGVPFIQTGASCGTTRNAVGTKTCLGSYCGAQTHSCSAGNVFNTYSDLYSNLCSGGVCNYVLTSPNFCGFTQNCGTEICTDSSVWRERCKDGDVWEFKWGKDDSCSAITGCDTNIYHECPGTEQLKETCESGTVCKMVGTEAECAARSAQWMEN